MKDNVQPVSSGEFSEKAVYCKLSNTSGKLRPTSAKVQQLWEAADAGAETQWRQARQLAAWCLAPHSLHGPV